MRFSPRLVALLACALALGACAVGRNEEPPPGYPGNPASPHFDIGVVPTFDGLNGTRPQTQADLTVDTYVPPPPPTQTPDATVDTYVPPPPPPPPANGWGAGCATDADCGNSLFCILVIGKPTGYCTQRCGVLGQSCPGTPNGQLAACVIQANDGNYCGFLCRTTDAVQHSCPYSLYCSPTDFPVGSGQHDCIAP
ncbi:MAG: hypothetical protein KC503_21360 [Myxococcales bacterium]|nr:hypothetical protein [Myxococcales bacterium]